MIMNAVATTCILLVASLSAVRAYNLPTCPLWSRRYEIYPTTEKPTRHVVLPGVEFHRYSLPPMWMSMDKEALYNVSFPMDVFIGKEERAACSIMKLSGSRLLEDLSNAEVTVIGDPSCGMKAIHINSSESKPFQMLVSPKTLFKRHFADDLLKEIADPSREGIILIGRAGTSKSMFQYILLHHLLTNETGIISCL